MNIKFSPLFTGIIISFFLSSFASGSVTITGRIIDDKTERPIQGVNIILPDGTGTSTDDRGIFHFQSQTKAVTFTIKHIGYETVTISAEWQEKQVIRLKPRTVTLPDIQVSATRTVPGVTPVSYSILTSEEISLRYTAEDVPMVLSSKPGVYSYSESGNGTGYSYISIRGFDQSRIAVMLDNVSLNDNESHQVYWVDHADILADAEEVEIQRGIGNSLYGAAAFGGSVNVVTRIRYPDEILALSWLTGSFGTEKFRLKYRSGNRFGSQWSISARLSMINSDGYRQDSRSEQTAGFLGAEYRNNGSVHQFRALLGKELSRLQWDGISADMLDDPFLRRGKMDWTTPFYDDFFQQIYSLNSFIPFTSHIVLRNTAYLVKGKGYYQVRKFGRDFYSYNLDIEDVFTDDNELERTTDLLRRKWITNSYFGITPVLTVKRGQFRLDTGAEIRQYRGDHFGEVSQFSDPYLSALIRGWYRYYDYTGSKRSVTAFSRFTVNMGPRLNLTGDLQWQRHKWNLTQQPIGHFTGYDIDADWKFFNPRFGFTYRIDQWTSVFANYGTAEKEPSDKQIIEADDVRDTPHTALPEKIYDLELGFSNERPERYFFLNYYHIRYNNEIISDIYDFEETEFDIRTADATIHEGLEIETTYHLSDQLEVSFTGSYSSATYDSGPYKGNQLTNVARSLYNFVFNYSPADPVILSLHYQYTGKIFIDEANTTSFSIPARGITNITAAFTGDQVRLKFTVNNLFNVLYATYGYEYWGGYYWPGATRNVLAEIEYRL